LIHKAKTEEPKTELQQRQTGLTGGYRSDRCATTQSGDFEASLTALVAGAEMLRSRGHESGSQGLRRG
jgi:hypothetical protein